MNLQLSDMLQETYTERHLFEVIQLSPDEGLRPFKDDNRVRSFYVAGVHTSFCHHRVRCL